MHLRKVVWLMILGVIGCGGDSNSSNGEINIFDSVKITKGSNLSNKDWICDDIDVDRICHPKLWTIGSITDYRYFYKINENGNEDEYFVLFKYPIKSKDQIVVYLKEIHNDIVTDSLKRVEDYTLYQMIYVDGTTDYYAEYNITLNGLKYRTYSIYSIYRNFLFDITLQALDIDKSEYYVDFQNVLYNLRCSNEVLFNNLEELKGYKQIKFDDL